MNLHFIPTLWTVLAGLGLVFALMARANAVDEMAHLPSWIQNGRRRLGKGHIRDETLIAVIDAVWLVVGLVYVAQQQPVGNPVVAIPLMATSALLAYSTLMRWRDRVYAGRPTPTDSGHLHRRWDDG